MAGLNRAINAGSTFCGVHAVPPPRAGAPSGRVRGPHDELAVDQGEAFKDEPHMCNGGRNQRWIDFLRITGC